MSLQDDLKQREQYGVECMEVLNSLQTACFDAGGCISINDLKKMTATELLTHVAPNGIRFVCVRESVITNTGGQ